MAAPLYVVALLVVFGQLQASAAHDSSRTLQGTTAQCRYKGKDYASGTLVSDAQGFCTCNNGVLEKCGCFNFDLTTVPAGLFAFKTSVACRCVAVGSQTQLATSNTDCVPLRDNIPATSFRAVTKGSDWGYTFDPAVSQSLNRGNYLPALETGITTVWSVAQPCASVPHWHPRGSEIYMLPSSKMVTMFSEEVTGKLYLQEITGPGLTVMPKGLLHTLLNPTCAPIGLFIAYNSNDQGRVNLPGINCAVPLTTTDGSSLLIAEHCKRVAACKATCGIP